MTSGRGARWVAAAATALVAGLAGCAVDTPAREPSTPTAQSPSNDSGAGSTDTSTTSSGTSSGTTGTSSGATTGTDNGTATGQAAQGQVEVVATGFEVPWGLALLGDASLLIGERDTGRVYRYEQGGTPELVTTVPGVAPDGEGGLLGIAVPPQSPGRVFYAYFTSASDNRVVMVEPGDSPEAEPSVSVILEGIPKAGNHDGGRIAVGPDGFLYISTGDASDGENAQDPSSLGGKILRVTPDGKPAPGNPAPDSPVFTLGHRNVQGLAWDDQGRLWASEFGQNTWDELNLIEAGNNYGWPVVEGKGGDSSFVDPQAVWPTDQASPSGLAYGPDGALYMAALRGESLWRIPVEAAGAGTPERLLEGQYGRLRSVVTDGDHLWLLTSNTFRGDPAPDDDRLLRYTP